MAGMNLTPKEQRFIRKMERAEEQWKRDVNARLQRQVRQTRQPKKAKRHHIKKQVWPAFGIDLQRWIAQNGRCYWCCCDLHQSGFHTDHVMPLAKGGTNHPSNLKLACPPCNLSKNANLPMDFALSLFVN